MGSLDGNQNMRPATLMMFPLLNGYGKKYLNARGSKLH